MLIPLGIKSGGRIMRNNIDIYLFSETKLDKTFQINNLKSATRSISIIVGSKATPVGDISADMLKVALDIHLSLMTKIINLLFENECFPDDLNVLGVSSIFKKNDDLDKENYRSLKDSFTANLMRSCKINCQTY